MTTRPHRLDREIEIAARPETVFRFFTDATRWASWWGAGSTIDAVPGGRVRIVHPGGVEVSGEVVAVEPPERIVFTYGYVSGTPIPVGSSHVTLRVTAVPSGSRVTLAHEFEDSTGRDVHVQGWRYQLSLFANVVSAEVTAGAQNIVDRWHAAWVEPDAEARRQTLEAIVVPGVRVRDRFTSLAGVDELVPHITAAQQHMPGVRLERRGAVRVCQGTGLADWSAVAADGREVGTGTNVYEFGPDGRLAAVTGLWK